MTSRQAVAFFQRTGIYELFTYENGQHDQQNGAGFAVIIAAALPYALPAAAR
jgi:hypothetical protein